MLRKNFLINFSLYASRKMHSAIDYTRTSALTIDFHCLKTQSAFDRYSKLISATAVTFKFCFTEIHERTILQPQLRYDYWPTI